MKYILKEAAFVIAMVLSGACILGAINLIQMDLPNAKAHPVTLDKFKPKPLPASVYYRAAQLDLNTKNFNCLARNIYYEAGVEGYNGKIAVAQVTWNRVKNGRWGDSFCKVIHAKHQFSWTKQRKPAPTGQLWLDSQAAARDFLRGVRLVILQDSKFYHATWIDAPSWTEPMTVKTTIGQHIFYAYK
jgi:spore germination cell wall hydrolase CwlJ-like protein